MRRTVSVFRPTVPLRCRHSLSLRPTSPLLIHPQLVRLLVAGGLIVADVFITAHRREVNRLRKDADGATSETSIAMSSAEALQILGLASGLAVPLRDEDTRREATHRFQHLFAISKELNNEFLQGKLSAAYRLCVDKDWDAKEGGEDSASGSQSVDS